MHDKSYFKELTVSNAANGYKDLIAKVDLRTYRRIPWEEESTPPDAYSTGKRSIPFFLVYFLDPDTMLPLEPCPRSFLKLVLDHFREKGWTALAGGEYQLLRLAEEEEEESFSDGTRDNSFT